MKIGRNPLKKSKRKTTIPSFFPATLTTLVAPILPEPCFDMLPNPEILTTIKPKGIDPTK